MKHVPYTPTESDLRAAHGSNYLLARIPFERAMQDPAIAICIRNLAEVRARRVPPAPDHFQLT